MNLDSAHAGGIIVAKNTELKDIQRTYNFLVSEIQSLRDAYAAQHAEQQTLPAGPATLTIPNFFSNFKPKVQIRSNTNATTPLPSKAEGVEDSRVTEAHNTYKALGSAFYSINAKYRIVWECADLLIENETAKIATGVKFNSSYIQKTRLATWDLNASSTSPLNQRSTVFVSGIPTPQTLLSSLAMGDAMQSDRYMV